MKHPAPTTLELHWYYTSKVFGCFAWSAISI